VKKTLVFLLATLVVTAVAWAQYTPNADPLLGPHNFQNEGCTACHAPHNAVLQGEGGFLWARGVPQKSYTTYGNRTLDTTAANYLKFDNITGGYTLGTGNDPSLHTVLCLSCHDTVYSGMTLTNPNNAVVDSSGTNLTNNHPVHVAYPNTGTGTGAEFWKVTVSSGSVKFADTTAYGYGHPTRLYAADGSTTPYIECGTCHNPHAFKDTVVTQAGSKVTVKTDHFVRGAYATATDKQYFCASCHADKSSAWDGTGNQ